MANKYNIVLGARVDTAVLEAQLQRLNGKYTIDFGAEKATSNIKGLSKGLDTASSSTQKFAKSTKESVKNTGLLNQNLTSAIGKFTAWYLIAGVVTTIIRKIKDLFTQVVSLDRAMTSLQMVTQSSDKVMQDLKQTYIALAKEMGVTFETLAKGADEWLRAGLNANDTLQALRASTVLSTIANMDSATATKYLIAQMNAYGLKASELMTLVDKMSAVDVVAATSSEELGEALALSAKSAELAGISYDKYLGILATVSETTRQSASSIGNAYKTIFARLQAVKLGSLVDEDGEDISNVDTLLKEYGVDIMEVTNNLTDMGALLDLFGGKWGSYTTAQKSEIATTVAGIRQREKFLVLMANYDRALELESVSLESAGSAMDKYGIYIESTEAKMNALKTRWTELADQTMSSGFLEFFVGMASGLVDVISQLGGLQSLLLIIIPLIATIKLQSIITFIASISSGLMVLEGRLLIATGATKTLDISMKALKLTMGALTIALTVALVIYAKVKQSNEEMKEAVKAAGEAAISSAKAELDALEKLRTEYLSLWSTTNKTELQKNRLIAITNELATAYGLEKSALDRLNSGTATAEDVYKSFIDSKINALQVLLDAQKIAYDNAQRYFATSTIAKNVVGEFDFEGTPEERLARYKELYEGKKSQMEADPKLAKSKAHKKVLEQYAVAVQTLTEEINKNKAVVSEYETNYRTYNFLKDAGSDIASLQVVLDDFLKSTLSEQSGVYLDIQKQISNLKKEYPSFIEQIDSLTEAFEKQVVVVEQTDFLLNALDERLSLLKKQQVALDAEKETQEKLLAIEKARAELAEAQRKKISVFRTGKGMVFEEDTASVQTAQENLSKAIENAGLDDLTLAINNLEGVMELYSMAILTNGEALREYFRNAENIQAFNALTLGDKQAFLKSFMSAEQIADLAQDKTVVDTSGLISSGKTGELGASIGQEILDEQKILDKKKHWDNYNEAAEAGYSNIATQREWARAGKMGYASYKDYLDAMYGKYMGEPPKYAKGTDSASGGLSMVGEKGAEMRVLNKGDGIIPSNITRNLMAIGSNPSLLGRIVERNNSQVINVGRVEVNGISDVDGFIQELSLIASR